MKLLRPLLVLIGASALLVGVDASAAGWNARWIGTPTCSATATTLTCSGKVAGLDPRLPADGNFYAEIFWKCDGADIYTLTSNSIEYFTPSNGQTFQVSWTRPAAPPQAPSGCASGTWIPWDGFLGQPGIVYFPVSLVIGQSSDGGTPLAFYPEAIRPAP
jgi:hypothetical protein